MKEVERARKKIRSPDCLNQAINLGLNHIARAYSPPGVYTPRGS